MEEKITVFCCVEIVQVTELHEERKVNLFQLQLKLYLLMIMFENMFRNFEETCKIEVTSIYKQTHCYFYWKNGAVA